jgi:PIN domain nuclease of toxin-antitoxin system
VIVLDTHAWIWWATRDRRLSARARRAIEADPVRGVSPLSCYEVVRLAERGRIAFDRAVADWIGDALRRPGVIVLDLTPPIAVDAARLADVTSGDPIDRVLAATALAHGAALVTKDVRLSNCPGLRSVW